MLGGEKSTAAIGSWSCPSSVGSSHWHEAMAGWLPPHSPESLTSGSETWGSLYSERPWLLPTCPTRAGAAEWAGVRFGLLCGPAAAGSLPRRATFPPQLLPWTSSRSPTAAHEQVPLTSPTHTLYKNHRSDGDLTRVGNKACAAAESHEQRLYSR